MQRLTKDKDYQDLKDICEGLEAVGQEPAMTHLRYIKLAEYERREEKIKRLAERIELILNDVYNTGRLLQDFDYEAIFKCTREIAGQTYNHRENAKGGTGDE